MKVLAAEGGGTRREREREERGERGERPVGGTEGTRKPQKALRSGVGGREFGDLLSSARRAGPSALPDAPFRRALPGALGVGALTTQHPGASSLPEEPTLASAGSLGEN